MEKRACGPFANSAGRYQSYFHSGTKNTSQHTGSIKKSDEMRWNGKKKMEWNANGPLYAKIVT